jgi:hypothetical protein
LTSRKPGIAADYVTDAGSRLRTLFSPVMRVIAIANDGVQKRAQDSHSAFNKEKRFEPEGGAVAKNADDDGNCDWKDHEQPDVVEHSDQLLMGHV